MAQNRDIEIGGVWANGAPDPPAEPIAENTYRNSSLTPQQVEKGWPFQKIVNSADFNEVMYRVTGLLRILEQWGVMPWSPLTTYAVGAHVLGSNNVIYKAIQATTGNDPISSPTQWENTGKGLSDHIAVQTNVHGSTNTPTANRLPQYDGSGRLKSNAPSVSNDVARKAETDAVQTNLDTHAALTAIGTHGSTTTATANRLAHRDAAGILEGATAVSGNDLVNYTQWEPSRSIGFGQTWQDVLSSRSAGVNYQNTTGRPIQVSVNRYSSGSWEVFCGASTSSMVSLARFETRDNARPIIAGYSFIVPNGWFYRLDVSGADDVYSRRWVELR